jgi:hypothetical protein
MIEDDLRRYLLKVATQGYADKEKEREWTKEPDGSTTIGHADGQWSMHDNFFGGEPYGGREVVRFEGKPAWMMVYYGAVDPAVAEVRAVYSFLQDAMARPDETTPVRGPRAFEAGSMSYEASWDGDICRFVGTERILDGGREIYGASFAGGLVDVRKE